MNSQNIAIKYEWEAVSGVSSYVFVIMDQRDPSKGMAVAFSSTVTSIRSNDDWISGLGGIDVGSHFGLGDMNSFSYVEGGAITGR